jgi:hypothetical protein
MIQILKFTQQTCHPGSPVVRFSGSVEPDRLINWINGIYENHELEQSGLVVYIRRLIEPDRLMN